MVLYPPLRNAIRLWGVDHQLVSIADLFRCETQGFGERPEVYDPLYKLHGHNGLDFLCKDSEEILACHDGVAAQHEEKNADGSYKNYGKYVEVVGDGVKTVYAHFKEFGKNGAVKQGDVIGYADSTGFSSGTHLHLTVKLLDSNGETLNKDNGYLGAIDPTSMFTWFEDMILTKSLVRKLQALEGYSDEDGVNYWGDGKKTIEQYLDARIPDKIKELERSLK